MQRERRLNGAAKAAAALIGVRLDDDAIPPHERELGQSEAPPQWLAELDEYEAEEELWLALYSPLDELHEARIAAVDAAECGDGAPRRTSAVAWFGRRGTCTTTKR